MACLVNDNYNLSRLYFRFIISLPFNVAKTTSFHQLNRGSYKSVRYQVKSLLRLHYQLMSENYWTHNTWQMCCILRRPSNQGYFKQCIIYIRKLCSFRLLFPTFSATFGRCGLNNSTNEAGKINLVCRTSLCHLYWGYVSSSRPCGVGDEYKIILTGNSVDLLSKYSTRYFIKLYAARNKILY